MRNNNAPIINKLIRRALTADKKRNLFITAAIALTTLMIATVFSIGMSYSESIVTNLIRMEGSVSHMGFANPTAEQLAELYKLDYVKFIGLAAHVAQTDDVPKLNKLDIAYVNQTQWKEMFCPAFTDVIGHYAKEENEVMLSRYILDAMGISQPKIGMEIPLSYVVRGTEEIQTGLFTLSCIYTGYSHCRPYGFIAIFISEAFAQRYGKTAIDNLTVNVIFKNAKNVGANIERIKRDLAFYDNQYWAQSPAFAGFHGNTTTYIILLLIIMFLMLTGYLLIYNVMYISVSKDVRFYGMLKALGTTPRQIRQVVVGQVLSLCGIGLPVACVASAAISLVIIPAILKNSGFETGPVISFSPVIYLGAIIFATLTALFGAAIPAKKAANIVPVEALRFVEKRAGKMRYHSSTNGRSTKMALRNIFRNHKQAVVVILSLFLGVMVFTSIMTVVISIDPDHLADIDQNYDFTFGRKAGLYPDYSLSDEVISQTKSLPGIAGIGMTTLEVCKLVYTDELDSYVDWLVNQYNTSREEVIATTLICGLRGIDALKLQEISEQLQVPIDTEAFERGEIAFIVTPHVNKADDHIAVEDYLADVPVFKIKGSQEEDLFWINNKGVISYRELVPGGRLYIPGPEFLVSNVFLRQFYSSPHVTFFDINVEEGYDEQIYNRINDFARLDDIEVFSRYESRKTIQDSKTIMLVLGAGASLVLGLIGMLNFINVMSVGIMTRKRELAAFESIGMSKRQMRSMLRSEGVGYAAITIICSLALGNLLTYGLFLLLKNVLEYTRFSYPFIPVLTMYIIILLICYCTPTFIYRGISQASLVERLREAE